jgi:hypothetical protein
MRSLFCWCFYRGLGPNASPPPLVILGLDPRRLHFNKASEGDGAVVDVPRQFLKNGPKHLSCPSPVFEKIPPAKAQSAQNLQSDFSPCTSKKFSWTTGRRFIWREEVSIVTLFPSGGAGRKNISY